MTEVEIIRMLGSGNFGDVYMGIWHKPEASGIVIDVEVIIYILNISGLFVICVDYSGIYSDLFQVALKKLKVREQLTEFLHEASTLQ